MERFVRLSCLEHGVEIPAISKLCFCKRSRNTQQRPCLHVESQHLHKLQLAMCLVAIELAAYRDRETTMIFVLKESIHMVCPHGHELDFKRHPDGMALVCTHAFPSDGS